MGGEGVGRGHRDMRIIAGDCRGRRIEGPSDDQTRPTSDLVREAIFNILAERIEGANVIDLFAGTGALGLEALSRGAASARFVEVNRGNVALIKRNIQSLGYADVAKVSMGDAHRFGRAFEPEGPTPHLIFLDPPYVEFLKHADKISNLVEVLVSKCGPGSSVVVESGKHWDDSILPDRENWDLRRYGGTVVAFRWIDPEADDEPRTNDGPSA